MVAILVSKLREIIFDPCNNCLHNVMYSSIVQVHCLHMTMCPTVTNHNITIISIVTLLCMEDFMYIMYLPVRMNCHGTRSNQGNQYTTIYGDHY